MNLSSSKHPIAVLLHEYVREHSASTFFTAGDDLLLAHRYVIAPYCCPVQYGDSMGIFLDSVALGMETDTTFLWAPVPTLKGARPRVDECGAFLQRREWVPTAEAVVPQLASAWKRLASRTSSNAKAVTSAVDAKRWMDALNLMGLLLPTTHQLAVGREARIRARDGLQAIYATRTIKQRQLLLYSGGFPAARGALFELAYFMDDAALLRGVNVASAVYAVHLRHYRATDDGTASGAEVAHSLRDILPPHFSDACALTIASDRLAPLRLIGEKSGCTPIALKLAKRGGAAGRRLAVHPAEHGPWGRQPKHVLEDIALLSLARSGFIV